MTDLGCQCPGLFQGDECRSNATQEDGFCDWCRCEHGTCVDHKTVMECVDCHNARADIVWSGVRSQA